MKKQAEAKEKQGYDPKPVLQVCKNCEWFDFDTVQTQEPTRWNPKGWFEDKNMRCTRAHFAVKKMATCKQYEQKRSEVN